MNGILHLGHAFTLAKVEFQARYQKILGKNVLFPFGFHCTGMPICAAANKIKREMEQFGNPPVFPVEVEVKEEKKADAPKKKAKGKKKLAKKKSKAKYQWQIMQEMNVPDELIAKFADPNFWLTYFPPIAMDHLRQFGLFTDFRRSFITTEINPYYDAFIRWQFNTLKAKDKIEFGSRNAIFSPVDDQPCADHDRSQGEGVQITDFTLIKIALLDVPDVLASIVTAGGMEGKKIILPAATLRPETMYGQTNLFLLPEGDYGVYKITDDEVYVCSDRSALNMSYQGMTAVRGKPEKLGSVKGMDLMGCAVKAPNAVYEKVYVLPLLTIKMNKGTGVVTSVPSDAPDDWAALTDLKKKEKLREKFNITAEMVEPFEVVPIINIPEYGNQAAADLCVKMKVISQNDAQKLAQIKDMVYSDGFYKGTMLVGECKGMSVADAKPVIKQSLIDAGHAALYSEPESTVISRSGDECVVALTDQWYLHYGEETWKNTVEKHIVEDLECYNKMAKEKFVFTINWLHEWACSRSFGLGTKLPWDKQFVIESLSDSTIYMAYYTIAHFLQGGVLDGSQKGSANIAADQLTDAVFDYVFLSKDFPADCGIEQAVLDKMRHEFQYWYPMDLRVSGKDLIGNHLTMSLYNHAAIWDEQPEMMPRSFFTNGHLMINAKKMSKSTGNFKTLKQAMDQYGVDATRISLAQSGDSLEDANFEEKVATANVMRLTKTLAWINEALAGEMRSDDSKLNFWDQAFDAELDQCIRDAKTGYDELKYQFTVTNGFYRLCDAKNKYMVSLLDVIPHRRMVVRFLEVLCLTTFPLAPHYSEQLWSIWKKETNNEKLGLCAVDGRWPVAGEPQPLLLRKVDYIRSTIYNLRAALAKQNQLAKKKKKDAHIDFNTAQVEIATEFPEWQVQVLNIFKAEFEKSGDIPSNKEVAGLVKELLAQSKKMRGKVMGFASSIGKDFKVKGATVFEVCMPFDELELVKEHSKFMMDSIKGIDSISVVVYDPNGDAKRKVEPMPGVPTFTCTYVAPQADE